MEQLTPILELKTHTWETITFYSYDDDIVQIVYTKGQPLRMKKVGSGCFKVSKFIVRLENIIEDMSKRKKDSSHMKHMISIKNMIHEITDVELFKKWLEKEEEKGKSLIYTKQALFYYKKRQKEN